MDAIAALSVIGGAALAASAMMSLLYLRLRRKFTTLNREVNQNNIFSHTPPSRTDIKAEKNDASEDYLQPTEVREIPERIEMGDNNEAGQETRFYMNLKEVSEDRGGHYTKLALEERTN
ncbi:hypothetical protein EB796_003177 [Bugula neritina]|uniref:Uncharacterized protein n=1 Tax=Bugula neritina TaxID=10212 RepID=A0A7J7KIJ3_BUGNE|nr:hypothetical protein EB796_003177 [Bugula neritina]